jgi:hypothetical protein
MSPSYYSNLEPSVCHVNLHARDLECLHPLEERICDETVNALGAKLTAIHERIKAEAASRHGKGEADKSATAAIVRYGETNGSFKRCEDLEKVPGAGSKKMQAKRTAWNFERSIRERVRAELEVQDLARSHCRLRSTALR